MCVRGVSYTYNISICLQNEYAYRDAIDYGHYIHPYMHIILSYYIRNCLFHCIAMYLFLHEVLLVQMDQEILSVQLDLVGRQDRDQTSQLCKD